MQFNSCRAAYSPVSHPHRLLRCRTDRERGLRERWANQPHPDFASCQEYAGAGVEHVCTRLTKEDPHPFNRASGDDGSSEGLGPWRTMRRGLLA